MYNITYFDYQSQVCYTKIMKRADHKSDCPINYTVEIFGDTWSMVIYRDMATLGKKTFGELQECEERIGSSVLTDRLNHLENKGIISKTQDPVDKRKTIYKLTPIGINAVPILYEIATWGSTTYANPVSHPAWFESMKMDRSEVVTAWRKALESGDSFFYGSNSAISQLGLKL
jgi:DNA-binding HxlR family transcriptional regulator